LPRERFFEKDVSDVICNIRWNHYNDKRRAKIQLLQEAYKRQALNSALEASTVQGKHIQSKSVFYLDSSVKGNTEDSVGRMKRHKEALAKRHKKNITQMLLHEFYWQIKFDENQKVRKISSWDDNSQNLDCTSSSLSTANRNRKEQIMLTNRRDAERAQRAAEMRAISDKLQEERKKEYDAHIEFIERKEIARKAMLDRQRAELISQKEHKRLETEKRIQTVLSSQHEQLEHERLRLLEKQKSHEGKLAILQEQRQERWKQLQFQAERRREHIQGIAYLLDKVLINRISFCGKHREMHAYQRIQFRQPLGTVAWQLLTHNHCTPSWCVQLCRKREKKRRHISTNKQRRR